jgi:hypothetical protein
MQRPKAEPPELLLERDARLALGAEAGPLPAASLGVAPADHPAASAFDLRAGGSSITLRALPGRMTSL